MLDNPFSEEIFPNIQSKPPLVQLEAVSSCPITCYLGKETPTPLQPFMALSGTARIFRQRDQLPGVCEHLLLSMGTGMGEDSAVPLGV